MVATVCFVVASVVTFVAGQRVAAEICVMLAVALSLSPT
jgi:hypothetical protein